jgi:hypothetical protein
MDARGPTPEFRNSSRGHAPGVNHLGLQAEDDAELEAIHPITIAALH